MCLGKLPDDLRKELRRDKDIATWQDAHEYVLKEMSRPNNDRLAAVHVARQKHMLETMNASGFVHAAIGDDNSNQDKFVEQMCAAMETIRRS